MILTIFPKKKVKEIFFDSRKEQQLRAIIW
jgi:hypothetical protein